MKKAGHAYKKFNGLWMWVNVVLIIAGGTLAVIFRHNPGPGTIVFVAAAVSIVLRLSIGRAKGMRL